MTERYARAERNGLADTLLAHGPDAPTLCEGWQTRDLAAHLVVRDRRPDAAPGMFIKPLAKRLETVQNGYASGDYEALVEKFRSLPLQSRIGPLDELMNLGEFYIHTEDVRRGGGDLTPRDLPAGLTDKLAGQAKFLAMRMIRKFPATVLVEMPGGRRFQTGAGGSDTVIMRADPGELMLFFYGRQQATNVEIEGPDALVVKLRGARLGI
jgi:uncharacterized protein (TIGR03085 family)